MYWRASHCVYDCRYHIVWITKYRNKCLSTRIQERLEVILTGICKEMHIRIIKIGMEEDHVHLYLSIPPVLPLPMVIQKLKGRTSKVIRKEFPEHLCQFYWKQVLWAVGYFVTTVGEITHETIKRYVAEQGKKCIAQECREVQATGL